MDPYLFLTRRNDNTIDYIGSMGGRIDILAITTPKFEQPPLSCRAWLKFLENTSLPIEIYRQKRSFSIVPSIEKSTPRMKTSQAPKQRSARFRLARGVYRQKIKFLSFCSLLPRSRRLLWLAKKQLPGSTSHLGTYLAHPAYFLL